MTHAAATALIIAIVMTASMASASAEPCGVKAARLRNSLPQDGKGVVGTAPQTVDAQLGHQPTPESIARAKEAAQAAIATTLTQAETFDAQGKPGECRKALATAKRLLNP